MGKQFGELAKIRGVVYFRLSPYEQRAFKGFFSEGIPNVIRRFRDRVWRIGPFFLASYLIVAWADEANHKTHRKDPKMYENDT